MIDFDQKQIEILCGLYTSIAKAIGCTPRYVVMVINGERKGRGKMAKKVLAKANELLKVLQPSED